MSDRLSLGPIQVFGASPQEINDALRQLTERIDELKGLRGRTLVFDRVRADDPQVDQDVVTRGSLATLTHVVFLTPPTGKVFYQPGASFTETDTLLRRQFDFSSGQVGNARLTINGFGTETGSHGVRVTDAAGVVIASVTWTGNSEGTQVGTTEVVTTNTDTLMRLQVSGASATDSLVLKSVVLELGI